MYRAQLREGRRECVGAGRNLDGHGQDVVDDQGRRRDLSDVRAEVVPRHDVGASRLGVGGHHLAVRERDEEQDADDRQGDWDEHRECCDAQHRDEDGEHLLGPVVCGRDHVRSDDAEGHRLAEAFLLEALGDERRPEEAALQTVGKRLGDDDGCDLGVPPPVRAGAGGPGERFEVLEVGIGGRLLFGGHRAIGGRPRSVREQRLSRVTWRGPRLVTRPSLACYGRGV